ncbi:DNA repair protein RecO [Granulosicoccus antarcticus]|uniref:DNA repair protein RecO n=1 Tax=Granulosicoccus antarcticus IMCC3135 TaxID=1192854 RepID=A0A2Z2NSH0_9GAMM|nr:DNA repair protein RecO [Granulosicoccus antarcticus]ASJ74452.1 DNA repair protein RecO [Granulosicoccus antarcticus IMCC3135]
MQDDGSVSTSLQPAYILHYTQWAETSFIVDAFTLSHGRIGMMAKSARSSKPRTRALYQPFRPLLLSWVGGSDMRTLTGIEESGAPLEMESAELACSYYINELILRLLGKDQPQQAIFAHYVMALMNLAATGQPGQASMESVLRTFELQLLEGLAVLPDLARCTPGGKPIEADLDYHYHPANAVAIPMNRSLDSDASLGIQKEKHRMGEGDSSNPSIHADGMTQDAGVKVSGRTLLALDNLELDDPAVLKEARPLMRQILRVHLGDKPLRSRELFESLARRE